MEATKKLGNKRREVIKWTRKAGENCWAERILVPLISLMNNKTKQFAFPGCKVTTELLQLYIAI